MTLRSAEEFPRRFAALWAARDAAGIAELTDENAEFLSLTGGWAEGRQAIEALLRDELAGSFSRSRLVTGKTRLRPLGPGASVLHQRFVLSGLVDADGRDLGRLAAMLTAVLTARNNGWQAVSLQFTALTG